MMRRAGKYHRLHPRWYLHHAMMTVADSAWTPSGKVTCERGLENSPPSLAGSSRSQQIAGRDRRHRRSAACACLHMHSPERGV